MLNTKKFFSSLCHTDSLGVLDKKIYKKQQHLKAISHVQIFECSFFENWELGLGTYFPYKMNQASKIVICDFDKTLVETKYSSSSEIFKSLNSPIHTFPTVQEGLDLLNTKIESNYNPFILSASPHFYLQAIRDWLYRNEIYNAEIFLKDYRQILSFFKGVLTFKDVKYHGFYKLHNIISILKMTQIPSKLCLIGDAFESDLIIYISMTALLSGQYDPWELWKKINDLPPFKQNFKQKTVMLKQFFAFNNMYQNYLKENNPIPEIEIYIRTKKGEITPPTLPPWGQRFSSLVQFF